MSRHCITLVFFASVNVRVFAQDFVLSKVFESPAFYGTVIALLFFSFCLIAYSLHRKKSRFYRKKVIEQEKDLVLMQQALEVEQKLKEKEKNLKESYSRFVPPDYIDMFNRDSFLDIRPGDQVQKEMSIMFAEIHPFTSLLKEKNSSECLEVLNMYLLAMEPVFEKHHGFVDRYVGATIMAVFPRSPRDAIRAAVEMQKHVRDLFSIRKNTDCDEIQLGLGIHSGTVKLGVLGGNKRIAVTVLSDVVDVAARLESLNRYYQSSLIISEDLAHHKGLADEFTLRELEQVRVSSSEQGLLIFDVLDAESEEVFDKRLSYLDAYLKGLRAIQSQHFEIAERVFKEIVKKYPDDAVSALQLRRLDEHIRSEKPWKDILDFRQ